MPNPDKGPMCYWEPADHNDKRRWILALNAYQRDNLLWLLNLVGYGGRDEAEEYGWAGGIKPFTYANTGDWVGEVAVMLAHPDGGPNQLDAEKTGRPNSTRDYIEQRIREGV